LGENEFLLSTCLAHDTKDQPTLSTPIMRSKVLGIGFFFSLMALLSCLHARSCDCLCACCLSGVLSVALVIILQIPNFRHKHLFYLVISNCDLYLLLPAFDVARSRHVPSTALPLWNILWKRLTLHTAILSPDRLVSQRIYPVTLLGLPSRYHSSLPRISDSKC
jgi:hypothetical protein